MCARGGRSERRGLLRRGRRGRDRDALGQFPHAVNYQTRPITKAINAFYEQRFKKNCQNTTLAHVYHTFVHYDAVALFWGFGFRFTLRDASGKAVKLSDLGVAAFKGLTHLDAPFGRMA